MAQHVWLVKCQYLWDKLFLTFLNCILLADSFIIPVHVLGKELVCAVAAWKLDLWPADQQQGQIVSAVLVNLSSKASPDKCELKQSLSRDLTEPCCLNNSNLAAWPQISNG